MSATKDGGPAFPCEFKTWNCSAPPGEIGEMIEGSISFQGMSLRDYFAAKASEEDIQQHRVNVNKVELCCDGKRRPVVVLDRELSKYAYADAMLAAREAK